MYTYTMNENVKAIIWVATYYLLPSTIITAIALAIALSK
jgi:hypothetical protein